MRGARIVITAETPRLGARGGALADRLRDLGDRLQVRGGRSSARSTPAETPDGRPGRGRAAVRDRPRGRRQAAGRARRPERADVPDDRVLRRPRGAEKTVAVGGQLRYFGDGLQASKVIAGRRYWRIPVMEGEFLVEERFGVGQGRRRRQPDRDGARTRRPRWRAAEAAVEAMRARARARSCRSRAGSPAAAARSARATSRSMPPRPTTSCARRCARRSTTAGARGRRLDVRDRDRRRSAPEPVREAMRARPARRRAARARAHHRRQLRRQARQVPLPAARSCCDPP